MSLAASRTTESLSCVAAAPSAREVVLLETPSVSCAALAMARAISCVVAFCSSIAVAMSWAMALLRSTVWPTVRMAPTVRSVTVWISVIWPMISAVARVVCAASCFTSPATTAKPLPASPARAASMVAFRASRLVWLATAEISLTISPIRCAARANCCTVASVLFVSATASRAESAAAATWRLISPTLATSCSVAAATDCTSTETDCAPLAALRASSTPCPVNCARAPVVSRRRLLLSDRRSATAPTTLSISLERDARSRRCSSCAWAAICCRSACIVATRRASSRKTVREDTTAPSSSRRASRSRSTSSSPLARLEVAEAMSVMDRRIVRVVNQVRVPAIRSAAIVNCQFSSPRAWDTATLAAASARAWACTFWRS